MPRLTLGAWLFVFCLIALIAGCVQALIDAIA